MLGCVPFTKMEYRVLNTVVLPDPWLTQEGLVTFPACALYQLFVRSCNLAHDGQHCSHFCTYTHRSLLLHLSLVFAFVSFCSQMEEHQTGNSLSAPHTLQQLHDDTVSTSVHPLVSTQETNGTTSSGSVSGPQLPHGLISSHVPAGPTRNVTGEVMPTSLAEAVTQFSFLEFLQRCNLLIAPPQLSQLPVPISLLDAAVQTTPPCDASQDVSTQTSDQPVSSFSFDVAAHTPFHSGHISSLDAAVQPLPHNTASQDLSSQMGARPASSFSLDAAVQTLLRCSVSHDTSTQLPRSFLLDVSSLTILLTVRARHRHKAILVVPHRLNLLTLLRLAVSIVPALTETVTCALWPHVSCCSHHRVSNSMPRLQVSIMMPTCAPHMAYLLKRHLCDPGYVQLSQSRPHSLLLVPSMWEHILCAQLLPAREVLVPPLREPTILSIQILVQGLVLFLNHGPWFFLWSTLVNPNLMGTVILIQPTVISCIINIVFPFFSGIQAWRAEILPTLSLLLVVSFMQLFFKKPVTTFRTSLSSSLCARATRTLLSCSIKTPLSLTQKSSHTRLTPQAKVRGVWSYSSFEVSCDVHLSLDHRLLLFAQYTFTLLWLRNVMHLLSPSSAFMDI